MDEADRYKGGEKQNMAAEKRRSKAPKARKPGSSGRRGRQALLAGDVEARKNWKTQLRILFARYQTEARRRPPSSADIAAAATQWLAAYGSTESVTRDQVNHWRRDPGFGGPPRVPRRDDVVNALVWALDHLGLWTFTECTASQKNDEKTKLLVLLNAAKIDVPEERIRTVLSMASESAPWIGTVKAAIVEAQSLFDVPAKHLRGEHADLPGDHQYLRAVASSLSQTAWRYEFFEALDNGGKSTLMVYYPATEYLGERLEALPEFMEFIAKQHSRPTRFRFYVAGRRLTDQSDYAVELKDAAERLNRVLAGSECDVRVWKHDQDLLPVDIWALASERAMIGALAVTMEDLMKGLRELRKAVGGDQDTNLWPWTSFLCPLMREQLNTILDSGLSLTIDQYGTNPTRDGVWRDAATGKATTGT